MKETTLVMQCNGFFLHLWASLHFFGPLGKSRNIVGLKKTHPMFLVPSEDASALMATSKTSF
jgi:hypothetical protein